ncbi:PAS domain-containing sensor histidine kinase [bacterium]|nr:PAS domain-containing sensor histidine kinase [bacterium]NBX97930.1 PAS domain-containing sensor histidine kinase [bacterium]NDC94322.1 PAS domain-containing sensor histidine kinase [bacterium]NDD82778.1 PAS domain-containing sensor histidine kinase [bacterium]NDG28826.1 PAS domain-containing sensor histidine kinase [bacterium]
MDTYKVLTNKAVARIFWLYSANAFVIIGLWLALAYYGVSSTISLAVMLSVLLVLLLLSSYWVVNFTMKPLAYVRQGILHVSSNTSRLSAPQVEELQFGRELATQLLGNVYTMAAQTTHTTRQQQATTEVAYDQTFLNALPTPVFTVTGSGVLHYINDAGLLFLGQPITARAELQNKNIYDVLNLTFPNEATYETWLQNARSKVLKATISWERVRLVDANNTPIKQFDMAASYSKAGGEIESIITIFDHSDLYNKDDQEISFVAMAVHELRTPLTVMRGYIEVFEDELGPTLSPELKDFMHKMNASAQQLTAFVSNILNVARVEENQLLLTLQKHNLKEIMVSAVSDLQLRAAVHGKHIELSVPDTIPDVAVDRISLHEVINNLVDNAIKYSDKSDKIIISAHTESGMVQIDVQDFGLGIPDSVVPKLFDKFYRSHRSKVQIGGTGLGLYLCKAIVTALGGNIWVHTKEGAGSTFSFTIEPYSEDKHAAGASQDGIMRGAHGWIKNHSMYRR